MALLISGPRVSKEAWAQSGQHLIAFTCQMLYLTYLSLCTCSLFIGPFLSLGTISYLLSTCKSQALEHSCWTSATVKRQWRLERKNFRLETILKVSSPRTTCGARKRNLSSFSLTFRPLEYYVPALFVPDNR